VVLALYKNHELIHQDNINLHSDRRRSVFSSKLNNFSLEEQATVAQNLMTLSLAVDELSALPIKTLVATEKPLNQNEISEANTLLDSPLLLHRVLNEVRKLGVIGEERNILLYYLALTSRITDTPLSVIVKGASAAGKSYVISKVLPLFPTDAYKDLTDATPQSFYYLEADALAHKVVLIFEIHGGQKADYSIRSLQSEGKLKIQAVIKNPETGEMETIEREVMGPTGFVTTTTRPNVHPENETRNFTVFPDETEKQTSKVLQVTNAKYTGAEIVKEPNPAFINMQKLIRPYAVIIPFAEELSNRFPKSPIRVRRDYSKLMSLIENVTLLHQKQREVRTVNNVQWVIATLADYYIAQVLFDEILMRTIYEIHPKTEELLEKAKLIKASATDEPGQFTVRTLAKEIGWDDDTVRNWLNPAVRKGFVEVVVESKGPKAAVYKLSDKPIEHKMVMPQVEELYETNPDWLNGTSIYHPITGKQLNLTPVSTDVPTMESLIEEI
jgi:predicted transcriptional regulator